MLTPQLSSYSVLQIQDDESEAAFYTINEVQQDYFQPFGMDNSLFSGDKAKNIRMRKERRRQRNRSSRINEEIIFDENSNQNNQQDLW